MQSLPSLVRDSLDTQRTCVCVEGTGNKRLACHVGKSQKFFRAISSKYPPANVQTREDL
jgi:hypothetical protein